MSDLDVNLKKVVHEKKVVHDEKKILAKAFFFILNIFEVMQPLRFGAFFFSKNHNSGYVVQKEINLGSFSSQKNIVFRKK